MEIDRQSHTMIEIKKIRVLSTTLELGRSGYCLRVILGTVNIDNGVLIFYVFYTINQWGNHGDDILTLLVVLRS